MLSFLPSWLRGSLTGLLIALNTILLVPFVVVLAILKLIIPITGWRKICTWILIQIANLWVSLNSLFFLLCHRIEWDVRGLASLDPKQWYFVTCNHQSWADILVVQHVLNRRIPMIKFFLKQELIWVPVIGIAWWALDFPFMKRYSKEQVEKHPELKGKDLETTRKACEKFKYTPVTVFNFLEGTRFTPSKHAQQQSPYRHLLRPKAGGAAFVLGAMGEQLHTMLNITLYYPQGAEGFWGYLCGRIPQVVVNIETLEIPSQYRGKDYMEDEVFRRDFQAWVTELWEQKDALLDELAREYDRAPAPAAQPQA